MVYFKVLRSDLTHHGFKYQKGVNTDTIPFNPVGSCVPGGIYFTDADHIHEFLDHGSLIATVEIPEGTETVKDGLNKWRTHSINIIDYTSDLSKLDISYEKNKNKW